MATPFHAFLCAAFRAFVGQEDKAVGRRQEKGYYQQDPERLHNQDIDQGGAGRARGIPETASIAQGAKVPIPLRPRQDAFH